MEFIIGNTYTTVAGGTVQEKAVLQAILSARPQGYAHMPSYRMGAWDGFVTLFKNNRFPSGLADYAILKLKEHDIQVDSVGLPHANEHDPGILHGVFLRAYQEEAVMAVLENRRGILEMATNSGKTVVAASIIKAIGSAVVYIVPTRALLMQTSGVLEELLQTEIGMYGAGERRFEQCTVTTISSLKNLILDNVKALESNVGVFIDECHHTRADTLFENIMLIPGEYRLGMSGTPMHHDDLSDMKLIGATGEVLYKISNQMLIDGGFSSPPSIFFHEIEEPRDLYDAKYHEAYRTGIAENAARNRMIADIAAEEKERGPVLVLVNWIEHAAALMECVETGYAEMASGRNSKDEIRELLGQLGTGQIEILVATDIFGEGIDVPEISTVIMAAGGKSHISLLQRVGRGLRVSDGKERLHVHDFIDDTNPYLLKHSERRYEIYKQEGFETTLCRT